MKLAMYSESLKRMAIRLVFPSKYEGVTYLVGISCESMHGPFSFSNTNLLITTGIERETNEVITKISDKEAGFELITSGGFVLAQGSMSDFGSSFDDFLKHKE